MTGLHCIFTVFSFIALSAVISCNLAEIEKKTVFESMFLDSNNGGPVNRDTLLL